LWGIPVHWVSGGFKFQVAPAGRVDRDRRWTMLFAFFAGALGVGLSTLLFYGMVVTNIPADLNVMAERSAISILVLAQLPLTIVEGCFTAMLIAFLEQVKPDLLNMSPRRWRQDYNSYSDSGAVD
ncbi:MAG: hypothetical protein HC795_14000, partial [Coleofasciculaceae cyanobacterium RL_1_1]|nr:hypothetical protein [Coleofasciculaceae cyanobacterium RL_1_1]